MKTRYDVAIRMESKKLSNGFVVFKPTNVITGEFDSYEGIFTSIDGESYYTQDQIIADFDTSEDYICTRTISSQDFNEKYGCYSTLKDALQKYKDDNFLYKLLYFDEAEKEFKWIDFNILDLPKILYQSKELSEAAGESKEVYSIDNSDYKKALEDAVTKTFAAFHSNARNKAYLLEMMKLLDSFSLDVVDIMCRISNEFPEEFEKKTVLSVPKDKNKSKKEREEKYFPKKLEEKDQKEFYEERQRIIDNIKEVVMGHDEEIDKIVVAIFRLIRQYGTKNKGILITGSTGCGKSKICELIAENLGRPCKIVDTTQLSAPGYKGRDIESYFEELYDACGGNKEQIQNSIIVFDEVDKLGHSKRKDDVSGIQVLNRLLKFLDGTDYTISTKDGKVNISTKNMIVVFCGSFSSVYKNNKFFKRELGFNSNNEVKEVKVNPTTDDFIKLGGMPDEMMGRFSTCVHLEDLTKKDLRDILLKSTESPIRFLKAEFMGEAGVELEFTDEAIDTIAEECIKLQTFARGLNKLLADIVDKAFYKVTEEIGTYDKVIITKETIFDNSKFELHKVENKELEKEKIKVLKG